MVQLLQDLVALQVRRGEELSFDIKKCYDSLPWWALFWVARHAGIRKEVVRGFEAFCTQLRHLVPVGHHRRRPSPRRSRL